MGRLGHAPGGVARTLRRILVYVDRRPEGEGIAPPADPGREVDPFAALREAGRGLLPGVSVGRGADRVVEGIRGLPRTEVDGHEGPVAAVDGGEALRAGTEAVTREVAADELSVETLHVIVTDLVPMTREGNDRRRHGRVLLAANPAWISLTGLLEAPARPRAWYFAERFLDGDALEEVRSELRERILTAEDPRLPPVLGGCLGQVVLHWCAGTGFCGDPDCSLHNAHRQEDLLRAQRGWIDAWGRRGGGGFPEAVADAYCDDHRARLEEIREATPSR